MAGGTDLESILNLKSITAVFDTAQKQVCHTASNYHFGLSRMASIGGMIPDVAPVVCGGRDSIYALPNNDCHILSSQFQPTIKMMKKRLHPAAAVFSKGIGQSTLFITGGLSEVYVS